jgi:16S rRNA (cytosine967-C5)-methyltransferase
LSVAAPDAAPARDGLAARRQAASVLEDVLKRRKPLDETLDKLGTTPPHQALTPSDRGLTRAIAIGAIRSLGIIRKALAERLETGMPKSGGQLETLLILGAAQLLVLGTSAHAAVSTTVDLVREDRHAKHFAGLANAVLRGIAEDREAILAAADPLADNTPAWLAERWTAAYGHGAARAIAAAHLLEPPLDITVKTDAAGWAARLGGVEQPGGSIRLTSRTAIPQLPGYDAGAWWVQDMAAALPARLLDVKPGERVLDLCAAPGGKTAQLASAGALVTAVDRSAPRMAILQANLRRLGLGAECHVVDALAFVAGPFDAILLDAPCTATGTIRRHPDVAWSKTLEDVLKLADLQRRLLDHAVTLLRPGGRMVYATCSLEPEEGERQIAAFLDRHRGVSRIAATADAIGGLSEVIDPFGQLRSLPSHRPHETSRLAGLDGFFACRLVRAE